jgi:hypothetical protein
MLDLPDLPILDKASLIGGCVRLPLRVDTASLQSEVARLGQGLWGTSGGRIGVHKVAEALFLRGHAPAEGDIPVEDREPLKDLPYVRWIIETQIPATPLRCLLARVPAGGCIAPHIDRAPYFSKTIRIHVPVATHESSYMLCAGCTYIMRESEVWALNNSALHGVWNAHATLARTHLICDFVPSPALFALLAGAERALGTFEPQIEQHVANAGR